MELKKLTLEREFKLRELEIISAWSPTHVNEHFDITRYVRLMLSFNEQQTDFYFVFMPLRERRIAIAGPKIDGLRCLRVSSYSGC